MISENINALDLRDYLYRKYKGKWVNWLPEVLEQEISKGSELLLNKVQALQVCMSTDTPWREWHIFENVAKAFNNQIPNFTYMTPATLGECMTTMQVLKGLREEEFTEEVLIYVAHSAFNDQLVYVPFTPEIQPYLDRLIHDDDLRDRTAEAWAKVKNHKDLVSYNYKDDDALHQQLASLALADQYIKEYFDGSTGD